MSKTLELEQAINTLYQNGHIEYDTSSNSQCPCYVYRTGKLEYCMNQFGFYVRDMTHTPNTLRLLLHIHNDPSQKLPVAWGRIIDKLVMAELE
jgi:hypothetical protein